MFLHDLLDFFFARTTVHIVNAIPFRKEALTMGQVMGYKAYDRMRGYGERFLIRRRRLDSKKQR